MALRPQPSTAPAPGSPRDKSWGSRAEFQAQKHTRSRMRAHQDQSDAPPTRMRSKAEGVPPLCTWPSTVTRVSKPSLCTTSCSSGERKGGPWVPAHSHGPTSSAPSPCPHPSRAPLWGFWVSASQVSTEPAQGSWSWHVSVWVFPRMCDYVWICLRVTARASPCICVCKCVHVQLPVAVPCRLTRCG